MDISVKWKTVKLLGENNKNLAELRYDNEFIYTHSIPKAWSMKEKNGK